jgi:hypothetical protein
MHPKYLLRVAAVIMLLHNIGHTIGHSGWKKEPHEVNRKAIEAMTSNEFEFMGRVSTYARFYDGYGYAGTLTLLLVTIVLWMLATAQDRQSKNTLIVFAAFLLSWAVMEYIYFFPLAAAFTLVAAVLTAWGASRIRTQ